MQYRFQPGFISITAGSIDEESVKKELPKMSEHIYLDEKAGWFEMPDDKIPRYAKFPLTFQGKIDEWKKGGLAPALA